MNSPSKKRTHLLDSLPESVEKKDQEDQIQSQIQSQIQFVDSRTLDIRPDIDVGKVLISSHGLDWKGIHIETGENNGFQSDNVTVAQHYFAMNIGPAYEWEWKDGSTFKTEQSGQYLG